MDGTEFPTAEEQEIDEIVQQRAGTHGELLGILEEVQRLNDARYLPEEALERVSQRTGVPLSRIYNVATFYSFFNLKPQGKHTVTVCRGTACHTKGSRSLLDDIGLMLDCKKGLEEGEPLVTTPDRQFTVSTVACFGQCALAPVVAVDGSIDGAMTSAKLQKRIGRLSKGRKRP
ncbi:MAG: NAD(P)H-dependent oxidoreductase subunit E [Bacteroidetes bacterium]|nr:MAG: NAD(P)H-dependent oxidoreductase subunit E [Bacteroidota bacterium]